MSKKIIHPRIDKEIIEIKSKASIFEIPLCIFFVLVHSISIENMWSEFFQLRSDIYKRCN